ncbi:MAG: LytTR family DNA-binding domain-containing protein [Defluviitaleaceae bacterium]|nr:LytTR family DNA-binding domain-containing protein [Defluviitaleaceae bacterium]
MKIAICEDNEKDANELRLFIEKYFCKTNCVCEIFLYKNGDELITDFIEKKICDVQIAFLDIYMPGTNGIETAKKIRETNNEMIIVFTTVSKNHALEGYSVDARQYLVKPVNFSVLKNILVKCTEKITDALKFIEVLSDRLTVKIFLKDIIFIESFNAAVHIHTVCETVRTHLTLAKLEQQIEDDTFLRAQRSYIVNMRFIKKMTAEGFLLENESLIPFRKNDKLAVKQAYRNYLSRLIEGEIT